MIRPQWKSDYTFADIYTIDEHLPSTRLLFFSFKSFKQIPKGNIYHNIEPHLEMGLNVIRL